MTYFKWILTFTADIQEEGIVSLGNLRSFTFKQLQLATDNFSSKHILGAGGFGNVYKGKLPDGTMVAVKRLKDVTGTAGESQFRTELEMISLAVHRNLLRLIGFCATFSERLLVYPYMSNGSVAARLRGWKPCDLLLRFFLVTLISFISCRCTWVFALNTFINWIIGIMCGWYCQH